MIEYRFVIRKKIFPSLFYLLLVAFTVGCQEKKEVAQQVDNTPPADPVFKRVTSTHSGVNFKNVVEENIGNFFDVFAYVYNGGGVGLGDINNDGLVDIYFTGNEVPNKLYLNEGNLKFKDITKSAGVEGNGKWNNGVTMVDINQDGFMDIYVCKGGWKETDRTTKKLVVHQSRGPYF